MKIYDQSSNPILAPEGVIYAGCRGEGAFLVLRFVSKYEYVDRYYNQSGVEMFRESGELPQPLNLWQRLRLWFQRP